jgi:hypothetical protein
MTPVGAWPAIGGGGRQPRKILGWQAAIGIVLIVLLIVVKQAVAARETGGSNPLASLPGGQTVAAGLDIGGTPTDYDLQGLAGSYQVDGVVNLTGPDVAEQVAAASLQLPYVRLTISPGAAPTWTQLRTLAGFMHSHATRGFFVYLHDDAGGGRSVAAAAMLLLLRGGSWPAIREDFTAGELMSLSPAQSRAIGQLASALRSAGRPLPGNPYSGAKLAPW